jgi:hypothetical protein
MSPVYYLLLLSGAALAILGIILFVRMQRSDVAAIKLPSPVNVEISVPSTLLIFVVGIAFIVVGLIPIFRGPGEPSGISVRLDPIPNGETLSGPCPGAIPLTGSITVRRGAGDVQYYFAYLGRGEPHAGRLLRRHFDGPGEREINYSFRVEDSTSGVFYVDVSSPENVQSDQIPFTYRCT